MIFSLLFRVLILLFPFTQTAVLIESSSSDDEIIQGTLTVILPYSECHPLIINSDDDDDDDDEDNHDIEEGPLLSEPRKTCRLRLNQFLQNDRQFRRAFPTDTHRKLFFKNVFNSLSNRDETYYKRITAGKIVDNFAFDDSTDELAAFLLNFIDRQPVDILPEYSQNQLAINKLTRSIIKLRFSNHFYWQKLGKLLKISRSDLVGHVNNLPSITDYEKDIYKYYNRQAKRYNLITALPLALIPTNYWYMIRSQLFSSGSTIVEIILVYIIFLYLLSSYTYEQFLFEYINHQIKKHI